jgi:hypothetical protein
MGATDMAGWAMTILMLLLGALGTVLLLLYRDLKESMRHKVERDAHNELDRRITSHDDSIGQLYSKLHDGEVDRLKLHIELTKTLNDHHQSFLMALREFIATCGGNPKALDK